MQSRRTLFASFLLFPLALLVALPARAQESVADAARKAQAEKKPSAKPAPVFTNDNLDTIKGSISVVGETPAPPAAPAAQDKSKSPAADDKSKAPTVDDKSKAPATDEKTVAPSDDKKPVVQGEDYWKKTFAEARKKLADDMHELDILQREYNLKQQQYYSDPNTALREQYTRQDLTDTKTKITDKTAAVAQDKQALSDLEDQLRQAGGEPGWANP
jgi:hypothetical protein